MDTSSPTLDREEKLAEINTFLAEEMRTKLRSLLTFTDDDQNTHTITFWKDRVAKDIEAIHPHKQTVTVRLKPIDDKNTPFDCIIRVESNDGNDFINPRHIKHSEHKNAISEMIGA